MRASIVTRIMHTRGFSVGVACLCVLAACFYFFGGFCEPLPGDNGPALPSANGWIPSAILDFAAGIAGAGAAVVIMLLLNKIYNILRSMTSLYIAFFSAMMLATPDLFTQFYTGTALMLIIGVGLMLMLGCYREPRSTTRVFTVFLLLSFFSATQYCFAFFIPVFLVACAQMRIFNGRTLVASLLGVITPWWLMFGFGIIRPEEVHLPQLTSVFSVVDYEGAVLLLATAGLTALLFIAGVVLNLLKAIAYNARSRAVNGVLTITGLATIVAMCADYRNVVAYVPLLDFCAALQAAHYLSTHRADRSFIAVLVILIIYAALFACQIIM